MHDLFVGPIAVEANQSVDANYGRGKWRMETFVICINNLLVLIRVD